MASVQVANVPVISGAPLPQALENKQNLYMVFLDPTRVQKIRMSRWGSDGALAEYTSLHDIRFEMRWARTLLQKHPAWTPIDVTGR
jgi:regulator of PEP synthase PpsR (kinase-PPPase family)